MQARHPTVRRFRIACAAALLPLSVGAHADPAEELRQQVQQLMQKVAELEQQQKSAAGQATADAATANAVTAGATKGSFKLPGSRTSITLGGYVKADAVFSDVSAGANSTADQQYEVGNVPVGPNAGANERNQVKLHARQSRLFLSTATPSAWGDVSTHLEFDLFGGSGNESVSNSHNLRVRHAYASFGRLLAGQTWTTFSDPAVYPETVDFGGPAGQIFTRQTQVRWTQPFSGGQWSVALENPETVVALASGESFRADDDRFPDLAANVKFTTQRGVFSLAGMARQIRIDSGAAPAASQQKWGGALGVNGVVPFAHEDDLRFSAYYGNAIGRYASGFFTDGVLDSSSTLTLPSQWAALVAYRHFWASGLRSTVALSGLHASNPTGTGSTVNRSAYSEHLNLIWSPFAKTNFGIEYLHASRTIESGQSGRLNRVQGAAQYFF